MNRQRAIDICVSFLSRPDIEGYYKPIDGGARVQAYYDKKGKVWTIGYGNTYYKDGSRVKEGDIITREEAKDLLRWAVSDVDQAIYSYIKVPINDNQYAALLSLGYNWGTGRVKNSDLLKAINNKDDQALISGLWVTTGVTASGIPEPGLVVRRTKEFNLYTSGIVMQKAKLALLVGGVLLISWGIYRAIKK